MSNGSIGMSGSTFDAFVSSQRTHNEPDWAAKIQEKYWRARQKFLAKIEKNEDSCIVLSDSKLDAKLEIYRSIDNSSARLTNILESYQNSLFMFANEENALGILLKECGKHDKTKAGKILSITGRSLTQSSHQRIRLYMPLLRMFQEMETFHSRAVEDTSETVDKLESSRSQYRASLLWMKDISEKLNPDIYRQLDRFRRVQAKVRDDKKIFDGMQMDVVQKIDLLMASRCNLMNQILAPYQTILLETFERNHNNFKSVNDIIKNEDIYEYEFKTLKQLNPLKISDDVDDSSSHSNQPCVEDKTSHEKDLLGDPNEEVKDGNNNDASERLDEPSNLIDVSQDVDENVSCIKLDEVEDEKEKDTLGLLENLFGNRKTDLNPTEDNSKQLGDAQMGKSKQDELKALMSNLDADLFDDEVNIDKQIASLLSPSEKLQKVDDYRSMESAPILTEDNDIFARWARDADIDLLDNDGHGAGPSKGNDVAGAKDDNINLMDINPTQEGSNQNKSRYYA